MDDDLEGLRRGAGGEGVRGSARNGLGGYERQSSERGGGWFERDRQVPREEEVNGVVSPRLGSDCSVLNYKLTDSLTDITGKATPELPSMTGAVAGRLWKEELEVLEVLVVLAVPRARRTAGEPLAEGDGGAGLGPASPRARAGGQRETEASGGASTEGRGGGERRTAGEDWEAGAASPGSGAEMMIICLSGPPTPRPREEPSTWRESSAPNCRGTD